METNAVLFTGLNEVRIGSEEMPPTAEDQIQMRTRLSMISAGTEGWVLRNEFSWQPTPHPCVPGYQRAREVTAVGRNVRGWRIGQRAAQAARARGGRVVLVGHRRDRLSWAEKPIPSHDPLLSIERARPAFGYAPRYRLGP